MKLKTLYDNEKIAEDLLSHQIITKLMNRDLASLDKENFIIFPQKLSFSDDLDQGNMIFELRNGTVWTKNIVGIFSDGTDELRINSRFSDRKVEEDYFLRYMLQKVLRYNVIDNTLFSSSSLSYYNLLVFLFPYYLNEAMKKGIFKAYIKKEYNDSNVKGTINIARQIKMNTPFIGNVAYRTREFSFDNDLTQLIRHTIEKIDPMYRFLLEGTEESRESIRAIRQVTSSYARWKKIDVLNSNLLNPVKHGFYEEYFLLQQLCIQILSEEKSGFGENSSKIHGIMIDVSWLWEEYIGKVTAWKHYGRKNHLHTLQLFDEPKTAPRYPDFVFNNIPIDTKYKKKLDTRNDYNQMTTYIHILSASKGVFLQPSDDINQGHQRIGYLNGFGGEIFTYKFYIPQMAKDYEDFVKQIGKSEERLCNQVF